jgi:hypoxanthine phosphoribosyltransferase
MPLPAEPKFSKSKIHARVSELAHRIDQDFDGLNPLCLVTLKGALHFGSDLSRSVTIPHEVDFIHVNSYEDARSTGTIELIQEPTISVENRCVVILEDIVDTGLTAQYLVDWSQKHQAKQIVICTLLDKPGNRLVEIEPTYVGFSVDKDDFVVGYGMDYNEEYRSLSEIFILETSSPD